jgi:hypothetical protein
VELRTGLFGNILATVAEKYLIKEEFTLLSKTFIPPLAKHLFVL